VVAGEGRSYWCKQFVDVTVARLPATTQLSKAAKCNMVNGLRRGAAVVKGTNSGDGRLATSPAQVGTV
jgi:hypothetical protein